MRRPRSPAAKAVSDTEAEAGTSGRGRASGARVVALPAAGGGRQAGQSGAGGGRGGGEWRGAAERARGAGGARDGAVSGAAGDTLGSAVRAGVCLGRGPAPGDLVGPQLSPAAREALAWS